MFRKQKKLIETIKEKLEICSIDLNTAPANIYIIQKTMEQKKDKIFSIDLHLLGNVVVMKVVLPVNFIQVKQWVDNYVSSIFY